MELNVGFLDLFRLLRKLSSHKVQQYRLATKEYEVVNTNYGQVRGMKRKPLYDEDDRYYAFEGIPYAKPPIGELRFRAPQSPEPWSDVLDCLEYKSKPCQYDFIKGIVEGSEDCLYLNVYTKKLNSEKPLPVMVWIYGGGFIVGEASRELYGVDYFMQRDVVVVTISYRVGALGFLSLNDPDLQIPGNAGLKDQILALKWIKENIHFFNGDCNNITLFGESAGGASTNILMMTPQTKGLFHKAILQSGTALCPWVHSPPNDWAYRLACQLGFKGNNNDQDIYRYLAKQSPSSLVRKDRQLLTKQEKFDHILIAHGPVVEPYLTEDCVIPAALKNQLSSAWSNDIPIIIGGNAFEGLFHYATIVKSPYIINELTDLVNLLPPDVQAAHNNKQLKAMAQQLRNTYFGDKQPSFKETFYEFMDLMTVRTFWLGIHRTIKARQAYAPQTPTYVYYFNFDSKFFNHYRTLKCGQDVEGVCHADEISYLFNNILADKLPKTAREYKCIQRMVGMWYNFALTSNPNCSEIAPTKWDPIAVGDQSDTSQAYKSLCINDNLEFKALPLHDKLRIWESFYTKESLI